MKKQILFKKKCCFVNKMAFLLITVGLNRLILGVYSCFNICDLLICIEFVDKILVFNYPFFIKSKAS